MNNRSRDKQHLPGLPVAGGWRPTLRRKARASQRQQLSRSARGGGSTQTKQGEEHHTRQCINTLLFLSNNLKANKNLNIIKKPVSSKGPLPCLQPQGQHMTVTRPQAPFCIKSPADSKSEQIRGELCLETVKCPGSPICSENSNWNRALGGLHEPAHRTHSAHQDRSLCERVLSWSKHNTTKHEPWDFITSNRKVFSQTKLFAGNIKVKSIYVWN